MSLRISISSADPLARHGLASSLEAQGMTVLDSTGVSDSEAVVWDRGFHTAPGRLPVGLGGALSPPILALIQESRHVTPTLQLGVQGVLSRQSPPQKIVPALHAVISGMVVVDEAFGELLRDKPVMTTEEHSLTGREQEVLTLLAQGQSNKEIASRLFISEHTARFHIQSLMAKLEAHSRTEVVVRAARAGWLKI